ncbi:hypothetical protein F511_16303 [Dorcoceras hygrometricum]|uniref:Uncharacterized protein n=1 Tax=Dorcoceras hygrometricum TaxID=472368 RepID=A0A2Z7D861_9LAMI|nr:hypothetical protein F511_16303 [Dorcoceras hygrometricum]
MVNMFRALEATGLRGFLGCPTVLYEQELEQFFDTTLIQDGDIKFAGVFNLPNDGLIDLSEVPNDLVLQARILFSRSSKPVQFSCKKRLLKYEFRLLNDILAKSITVKVGSFDAATGTDITMGVADIVEPKVAEEAVTGTDLEEQVEPRSEDIIVESSEESMSIDVTPQTPWESRNREKK